MTPRAYDTKPKLTPSTREFFDTLAKTSSPPLSTYFQDLVHSSDPERVARADREISKDPPLHAIMRNTIAPVFLKAGFRGNVIPGSAEATLNFRTIPGTEPEELIQEIRKVIADDRVEVTLAPGAAASTARPRSTKPSPQDTELYRALVSESKAVYPEAAVTPYLFQAGTDASAWCNRDVPVYGIYPYPIDSEDLTRMHGNDERVSVDSLSSGTELIYRTLLAVAQRR